jgi:YggT family protein
MDKKSTVFPAKGLVMDHVLSSAAADFFQLVHIVLDVYMWVVIASAVLIWLIAFKIVDKDNNGVKRAGELLDKLTEPFLRPIRRVLKPVSGFDLAPLALLFIVFFLQSFVSHMHMHYYTTYYSSSSSMPFEGDGSYR